MVTHVRYDRLHCTGSGSVDRPTPARGRPSVRGEAIQGFMERSAITAANAAADFALHDPSDQADGLLESF
jgi:hypothetical protein